MDNTSIITEYDPIEMHKNAILLVIRNPRPDQDDYGKFVGCYGSYDEYLKTLIERHNPQKIVNVLGIDKEDKQFVLSKKNFTDYMGCIYDYIIPQYHLDRSLPIYVGLSANGYFLWISNITVLKAVEIKKYVFK